MLNLVVLSFFGKICFPAIASKNSFAVISFFRRRFERNLIFSSLSLSLLRFLFGSKFVSLDMRCISLALEYSWNLSCSMNFHIWPRLGNDRFICELRDSMLEVVLIFSPATDIEFCEFYKKKFHPYPCVR